MCAEGPNAYIRPYFGVKICKMEVNAHKMNRYHDTGCQPGKFADPSLSRLCPGSLEKSLVNHCQLMNYKAFGGERGYDDFICNSLCI